MRTTQLNGILHQLAQKGRWLMSESTLRLFAGEKVNSFRVAMVRHVRAGTIRRLAPGLYANPFVQQPQWALEKCVSHLRPDDAYYLTGESALHALGLQAQAPAQLTVMTTGRTYRHVIQGLGVIDFVHTSRPPEAWRQHTSFMPGREMHVADPELARADIRRMRGQLQAPAMGAEEEMDLIALADYPELKLLAWNRTATAKIPAAEALSLYERNWRLVDRDRLLPAEKTLINRLADTYGSGVLHV